MELVKKLNLNRNPKDVESGSFIAAKNIDLDSTASYVTQERGFKVDFVCPNDNEYLVGVIPCSEEIVIFTYDGSKSRVYRKPDNAQATFVEHCKWQWSGGKITGSFTYNYKGELIIAVGESDASTNVPFKTWNLDTDSIDDSMLASDAVVPNYITDYVVSNNGHLVCGVYTFFIRFQVSEHNYTKWFQITDDIIITQEVEGDTFHHCITVTTTSNKNDRKRVDVVKKLRNYNSNSISAKAITLGLNINKSEYSKYQIGYIYKHDNDVVGRILNDYNIDNTTIVVSNNKYSEEISVDDFKFQVNQFYNVRNVINYNNRIYLANYITDYEDINFKSISDVVSNITGEFVIANNVKKVNKLNIRKSNNSNYSSYINVRIQLFTKDNDIKFDKTYSNLKAEIERKSESTIYRITDTQISLINHDLSRSANQSVDGGVYLQFNTITDLTITVNKSGLVVISINDIVVDNLNVFYINHEDSDGDNISYWNETFNNAKIHVNPEKTYFIPAADDAGTGSQENPSGDVDDEEYDIVDINSSNNYYKRSFTPYQKYNVYIHFVKANGYITDGFKIKLDKTSFNSHVVNPIYLKLDNITLPKGYVSYFISYEEINNMSDFIIPVFASNKIVWLTNEKYIYAISVPRGNKFYSGDKYLDIDITNIKYLENKNNTNHIRVENFTLDVNPGYIVSTNDVTNKVNKVLYRLSDNSESNNILLSDKYVPSFLEDQTVYAFVPNVWTTDNDNAQTTLSEIGYLYVTTYELGVLLSASAQNAFSTSATPDEDGLLKYKDLFKFTSYDIKSITYTGISNIPNFAMSVRTQLTKGVVTYLESDNIQEEVVPNEFAINEVIPANDFKNYLELKQAYSAEPDIAYTNYQDGKFVGRFNKTINRSDVNSDESLINGFRTFRNTEYRNITENKGDIVNIIGIGLYLIIHTEYSMFVFDRSPKLTQKTQLDIPDTFDIDYQEVLSTEQGYGGLRDKDEAILCKEGYIWFDYHNKRIFKYNGGKFDPIDTDIMNFLRALDIDKVRFGEDVEHNRLLICIYLKGNNINNQSPTITLSYNFGTQTYISLHDYRFDYNYRTYKCSYFFSSDANNKLLVFDDAANNYNVLENNYSIYYAKYGEAKTIKSYVDIIYKESVEVVKALESIDYTLTEKKIDMFLLNAAENGLNRLYPGDTLEVYSNLTHSGSLSLTLPTGGLNQLNDYRHPHYNKGRWSFNYFKSLIPSGSKTTYFPWKDMDGIIRYITNPTSNGSNDLYRTNADSQSLMYGNYFVTRFIFNNVNKVKFENINFNVTQY